MKPSPPEHLVQAYTADAFLARVVGDDLADALARGQGAVTIATAAHTEAFASRLAARGLDVQQALAAGRLLCLDAERTLSRFMVGGLPDRAAFFSVVAGALVPVRSAGCRGIRLYGEMVDLLWEGNPEAALALEALWNEVLADRSLSLLCAYRMDVLDRPTQPLLRRVLRCHSRLLPAEDQEHLEQAVDRAYTEVFGASADVGELRDLLVAGHEIQPPMPRAHATMVALADLSGRIAADVAARARAHYRRRLRSAAAG